jgi:serine/threonine protein kinase
MDFEAGIQVTDNVTLVRRIGEGAMGEVWIAEHETLKTQVAVKFIANEVAQSREDAMERFTREARAAAQIKSPHVVQMFDHGVTEDGTPYIVMELLDGVSLHERLEEEGPLSPVDTGAILTQVGKALTAAHGHGIFHRDIKPHNIFLQDHLGEIHVKVLDFGIAKQSRLSRELTEPGTIVGTPQYVSRDLIMHGDQKTVNEQVDLWSMSVVAYKCLTASLPFDGDTIGKICAALAAGDFTPPSERRDDLGRRWDNWFKRAFDSEPENRFDSPKELSDSFRAVAGAWESGEPEDDEQPESEVEPERAQPPSPSRFPLFVVITVGVAIGLGIGFANYQSDPQTVARPTTTATATTNTATSTAASVSASASTSASTSATTAALLPSAAKDPKAADMVLVPKGKLWMGCHMDRDLECDADEVPGRIVLIDAFHIDRTEVSVLAYAQCVIANDCSERRLMGYAIDGANFVTSTRCNWKGGARERHPMNCISHAQAARFCEWRDARLPTEAEWERAARGDDKRRYPWGGEPATCLYAVMAEEQDNGCGKNSTWPVGSQPHDVSPFGALDMAGNVREWVADWYDKHYYRKRVVNNPKGPDHGSRRVARGGGWGNTVGRFLRVSRRESEDPGSRNMHLGFRCARDADDDAVPSADAGM